MRIVRTLSPLPSAVLLLLLTACGAEEPADASGSPAPAAETATPASRAEEAFRNAHDLAEAGNLEAAVEAYRETVRLDPEHADAHFLLGRTLVALSRVGAGRGGAAPGADGGIALGRDEAMMAEAIAGVGRAVELEPDNLEYRYWAGRTLHVGRRSEEAIAMLESVVARDPEHGAAYKRLGLIHLDSGDLDQARTALSAAERLLPDDPGVPFQLGNVLVEDDPEAARDAFRRSIAIDPTFASSYNGLVSVLARLGDLEGAEQAKADFERWRYFEESVRAAASAASRSPGDAAAQLQAGELYLTKRAWPDALFHFRRAVSIDATDPQAHFYCGIVCRELGFLDDARNHVEESIYLAPNALEPRFELIRIVFEQADEARLAELVTEIDGAAEGLDADARTQYADVLVEVELFDNAAEHYRGVLAANPEHAGALAGLERAEAGSADG